MTTELSAELLEELRQIPSCATANAIETFDIQSRADGFMLPSIKSIFPDLGHMIGYAVTGIIAAKAPNSEHMRIPRTEWVDYIQTIPEPRIIVLQDLDYPDIIGSFWGEVQANVHGALGCVGTITNGGVRDLDEMREKNFLAFASEVLVSHSYVHLVEYGVPVEIGGLTVNPGDVLMGDQHGVLKIPTDIAEELPAAVKRVEEGEQRIIGYCKSPDFTPEGLKELLAGRY